MTPEKLRCETGRRRKGAKGRPVAMSKRSQLRNVIEQLELLLGEPECLTVGELLDRWQAARWPRWAASTRQQVRYRCRLLTWLRDRPAAGLTGEVVAEVYGRHSGSTARAALRNLRAAYAWGLRSGALSSNPLADVAVPQEPRRERVLTTDERRRLWEVLVQQADPHFAAPSDCVRLLMLVPMRRDEARVLTWDQVRDGWLALPRTKNGQPRSVLLPKAAHALLEERSRGGQYVFAGYHGDLAPVSGPSLYRVWYRACEVAGVHDATLHTLRHTIATVAAEHGATVAELQELLGHRTPSQSIRYTHAKRKRVLDLVEHAGGFQGPRRGPKRAEKAKQKQWKSNTT